MELKESCIPDISQYCIDQNSFAELREWIAWKALVKCKMLHCVSLLESLQVSLYIVS